MLNVKKEIIAMDKMSDLFLVCINHLESDFIEYSVCRGYNFENDSWAYSLYYTRDLQQARDFFFEKLDDILNPLILDIE